MCQHFYLPCTYMQPCLWASFNFLTSFSAVYVSFPSIYVIKNLVQVPTYHCLCPSLMTRLNYLGHLQNKQRDPYYHPHYVHCIALRIQSLPATTSSSSLLPPTGPVYMLFPSAYGVYVLVSLSHQILPNPFSLYLHSENFLFKYFIKLLAMFLFRHIIIPSLRRSRAESSWILQDPHALLFQTSTRNLE